MSWASRAVDLLGPIVEAQSAHVLLSRVLAMDEISLEAGREAKGKMRKGWLWPVYGNSDDGVSRRLITCALSRSCFSRRVLRHAAQRRRRGVCDRRNAPAQVTHAFAATALPESAGWSRALG